jgi:DNA-nicking Smr family endonuclease
MSKKRATPPPTAPAVADDAALFRAAVAGAKPIRKGRAQPPAKARPDPVPRQRIADEQAVLEESLALPPEDDVDYGEVSSYAAPGVQLAVMRKLRRGQYRCEAEIDLHGQTRVRAHANLLAFIAAARKHGARCVRVVHGKGNRSGHKGPVLKRSIGIWLRRAEVLAWANAPANQGGSGATLVLLRAER